jgi:hypothetical protein
MSDQKMPPQGQAIMTGGMIVGIVVALGLMFAFSPYQGAIPGAIAGGLGGVLGSLAAWPIAILVSRGK